MKVLMLSCNTGQGHNTAARAVMEAFEQRGVECELRDALAFSSELTSKVVSETYVRMANDAPGFFGKLYHASDLITNSYVKSPVYAANLTYARKLGKYIRENGFDAVITTHVFPAQALGHLSKHEHIDAKTYFIATDYTCHPFTDEVVADRYFIAHADLIGEYVSRGLPRERLCPTGIPVFRKFIEHVSKEEARERLGIGPEAKVFLIMTGSMGFGETIPTVETIMKGGSEKSLIYIMTGRNEEMKQEIDRLSEKDPRVIAVPFTTEVPLYMSAADVLMTKPGGLTTTEAAALNIPLVLSAPIPGCETANANFFEEKRMAVCVRDAEAAAHAAMWLAADEDKSVRMTAAQARIVNAEAARDICDIVMGDQEQQR
ncbi:MAG: glycosyl transferase [Clostridia bacterium]|nr:glycosyl transferase [Clostridia bacterium]